MSSSFFFRINLAPITFFLFVSALATNNHNILQGSIRGLNLSFKLDANIVNDETLVNKSEIVEKPFRFPSLADDYIAYLGQHAGYVELHNSTGGRGRMFYYFFESRVHDANAPVVVWLTGGPGCSSSVALFYVNGPFKVTHDLTLVRNEYGWDKLIQKKDKDDHRRKFSPDPVGKRQPPPRPTKMSSSRDILLHHGGCWEGLDYTGGERELITIDFGPLCYDELLNTILECIPPFPNDCTFLLHSLLDEGEGNVCKKRIRKASDMNYIFSQTSNVQRHSIFVTIKKMGNVRGQTSSRDHQEAKQPAFDARTFGNVTRNPHVRQQAFDDRTFASDDKCIPPDDPKKAGSQKRSRQSAGIEGDSSSKQACVESDHNRK
ncbi:hypothetical protein CASFOL_030222 [Castilleja foliolosa]|uniref:Uncharacterized protein n=3 Tax=Castilleja foliolosa TaxID=1961234 RepID=A0ABD3C7B2_9LAMI